MIVETATIILKTDTQPLANIWTLFKTFFLCCTFIDKKKFTYFWDFRHIIPSKERQGTMALISLINI
jgi:hypothetical protein